MRRYRREGGTLQMLSSIARYEVRLPKVNRRQRGTRYDSPKLIVDSEVRVSTPLKLIVKVKSESEKVKVK